MNEQAAILISRHNGHIWIKVEAQGSFKNSPAMKKCAEGLIERGERQFVVDLESCPGMDSTFMGTLAGIALNLRERRPPGVLHVIRPGDRNRRSLLNLGLDAILEVHEGNGFSKTGASVGESIPLPESDRTESARTMLEAHESLIQAEPSNLSQFKDVIAFLREDLESGDD